MSVGGSVTAGTSAGGLLVRAFDADGTEVARALTDDKGSYKLSINSKYAGQALVLQVSDLDASDGIGYKDEATGESKDFGTALRATLVLDGSKTEQQAQITPLTELATRKIANANGTLSSDVSSKYIADTNAAIGKLFGVEDIVGGGAPVVVGGSDDSDAYGNALALLSGMDAVNTRQGAENAMEATLARLESAIDIELTGTAQAQFIGTDVDTLSLLSQAVSEMSTLYSDDTSLIEALTNVAMNAATTAKSADETSVFITAGANLLGSGKDTTIITFSFDSAPSETIFISMLTQLQVEGGILGTLTWSEGTTDYTATFTQSGNAAPRVFIAESIAESGSSVFFSNEVSMALDMQAPTLSVASITAYEGNTPQSIATAGAGDTLRITLSAAETLLVKDSPTLTLMIGGTEVTATYDTSRSSTRSLVFNYTVEAGQTDTDGVSVVSVNLIDGITDIAGNAAQANNLSYSGIAPQVDTTAPSVVAQSPEDGATVGNASAQEITLNFDEVIRKGTGSVVVIREENGVKVESLSVDKGVLAADGKSITFTLTDTPSAGNYTVSASSTAFQDLAGNTASSDASWNFTVGAVTLGIDKVSGDNLLNATEVDDEAISLRGSLSGASKVLEDLTASDLQVWLKPIAGGAAIQAKVINLSSSTWTATVAQADTAKLSGGYVVQASIDSGEVKSSASSVIVVDTTAQMAFGTVAGDDRLSLVEQKVIKDGKHLAIALTAENGATVDVTFRANGETVTKKAITGTGSTDGSSLKLTKGDLETLGSGVVTMAAKVTDLAGNERNVEKTFNIDAAATAASIRTIQLASSTGKDTLRQGDQVLAAVNFDKAVTVSGTGMTLAIQVGENTRQATFTGLSADRKTLNFSYTVQSDETDDNGVSLADNALTLNGISLKDLSGLSAVTTSRDVTDNPDTKVKSNAIVTADLAASVTEAGTGISGTATASGKLVTSGTVSMVKFGDTEITLTAGSTATSYGATTIVGKYGSWKVGADGSYIYSLNNADGDTQALKKDETGTDVLSFTSNGEPSQLTVTVNGTNDAPTVSAALTAAATEGNSQTTTLNLLENTSDVENDTLTASGLTYKVNGTTVDVQPDYLSLSNNTLSLDPTNAAFKSLKVGAKQTITVNYTVSDGQGGSVAQAATFTVTGTNDAPTVSAALVAADATEGAGSSTSLNLLSGASDVDSGDTLRVSDLSYQVNGADVDDIPAGLRLIGGTVLTLDPKSSAFNNLAAGVSQTITVNYTVTDGQGGSVAQTATFTITGTDDAPILSISDSTRIVDENDHPNGRLISFNGTANDLNVAEDTPSDTQHLQLSDVDTAHFGGHTLKVSVTSGNMNQLRLGVSRSIGVFLIDSDDGDVHYHSDATYHGKTGENVDPHDTKNTAADIVIGRIDSEHKGRHGDALWIDLNENATTAITQALASQISIGVTNTGDNNVTQDWSAAAGAKTVTFEIVDSEDKLLTSADRTVNIVSHADVLSRTSEADTYGLGDTITVTVTADEPVYVNTTNGTPYYVLDIGGVTKRATYASGNGTKQLTYTYVVEAGLSDTDGIELTSHVTNGAVISDGSGSALSEGTSTINVTLGGVLVNTDPLVSNVSLQSPSGFYLPGDDINLTVVFDQAVTVSGDLTLKLTLTDNNGTAHTVNATCQNTGSSTNTLNFKYIFSTDDTGGLGAQISIDSLVLADGSSLTGSNGASADLTLRGVSPTADVWLYDQPMTSSTGTDANDLLNPWGDGQTEAPLTLTNSGVTGGSGSRDLLGVAVFLPSDVTSQDDAATYYLNYVVTGSGNDTARSVLLMKQGEANAIRTYTVPVNTSAWPDGIESLAYYLAFKDADGVVQSVNGSSSDLVLLHKTVQAFADPTNDKDVVIQGSYRGDTIDLSGTNPDTSSSNTYRKAYDADVRVTIKGNQGGDTITGHDGVDFVLGQGGADVISTGGGNDKIFISGVASSTAETIDGGTGTDSVVVTLHGANESYLIDSTTESLTLQSAQGSWVDGVFTASGGYTSDYTLSVNADNKLQLASERGSSTYSSAGNTSVLTSIEQLEVRLSGSSSRFTAAVGVGTADADTLTAGDVFWALGGDDNISVVTDSVVFAGAGNDTVTLASSYMFSASNSAVLLGGAGIDTLKLSDSAVPTTPNSNWNFEARQFEVFDMTGAGNNALQFKAKDVLNQGNTTFNLWNIDGGDKKQQFMVRGDSGDTLQMDRNTWSKGSTSATVSGTEFEVWSDSDNHTVQLLVQQGVTVLVDTTAPEKARITSITDNSGNPDDRLTNDKTPTINFTAEAGATIFLAGGDTGSVIQYVVVETSDGSYKITVDSTLDNGDYVVLVQDASGNYNSSFASDGSDAATFRIDTTRPNISSGATAGSVDENSGAGQVVYTASADDSSDTSAGVSFSLAGADLEFFSIDSDTGEVTLTANSDYETKSSYSFTVTATDAAGNISDPQTVTLDVNDLNDNAPAFRTGAVTGAESYFSVFNSYVQTDGKVVVSGTVENLRDTSSKFGVSRLNEDGSFDTTFDNDGTVTHHTAGATKNVFGATTSQSHANTDETILVAGSTQTLTTETMADGTTKTTLSSQFAVMRLREDGTLDERFSDDGSETYVLGNKDFAFAIENTGRGIVVAGVSDGRLSAIGLQENGSLDTSFGDSGKFLSKDLNLNFASMALQSDGGIVLVGTENSKSTVVRLTEQGLVDTSFGSGGVFVQTDLFVSSVISDADDNILLVGMSSGSGFTVTRLTANGIVDEDFGTDGIFSGHVSETYDRCSSVIVQEDGKILLAGTSRVEKDSYLHASLMRLNSDGTLDTSFRGGGKVVLPMTGGDGIYDVSLTGDGQILVTGNAHASYFPVGVMRLDADGSVDTTFGDTTQDRVADTAFIIENITTNTVVYDANATDADTLGDLLYSLGGADADYFNFNEITGEVKFIEAQGPADGDTEWHIEITANDGVNTSNTLDVTIWVKDQIEVTTANHSVL